MSEVKPITPAGKSRFAFYIVALVAGGLSLAGYADFDVMGCLTAGECMLDIRPFDVKEFVLTAITTGGNLLAAFAVYAGLKSR